MTRLLQRTADRRIALPAAALVVTAFVATIPGPLRLDTDSGMLLELGASVADGRGLHPPHSGRFPPGYPLLLGALDWLGIAGPEAFVAMALVFLAIAIAAIWLICRTDLGLSPAETTVVCFATALSVYTVKYSAIPLTELPFLGTASAALAALALARRNASWAWLIAGAVLSIAACTIRSAGVALAVALVFAPASRRGRRLMLIAAVAGAVVVTATAPYALGVSRWVDDPFGTAPSEAGFFLRSLGSIAANVPLSEMDGGPGRMLTWIVGGIVAALVAWALFDRRARLRPTDGFVIGTLLIVLVYPTEHPRFLLPVLPFLVGYGALAARRIQWVGAAWVAGFAAVGLAALAYSVLLTYSGSDFPRRYAGGTLASTYRVAWRVPEEGDSRLASRRELVILRRYDPEPNWEPSR